ncbi:pseudaminic acid cytidylyltransferase [Thalassotalea sp. G2M2-11]|uniref:pseudaminic acid cytidylyltransferase n=1 Tax=Thalassotalea sp. G2M2-11 TaxID=2787627 RepID=UPI0019D13675|nr:pseudaminic acid cytidylyltransferase [Thalassotalea sp. G2M2-11]
MKNIAIIPARGGSKRIPRKNIREFCGKPIIAYSIEAALRSQLFEHVIVSTDDEEIAAISRKYGAEVPFVRPANLSDDYTGTNEVVVHAIQYLQKQGVDFNYVCCLYATAPFVQQQHLQEALEQLMNCKGKYYAFSVGKFDYPVQRSFTINVENKNISLLNPESIGARSQDLPDVYHDAGQFYWALAQDFVEIKGGTFSEFSIPYILPNYLVQDIDTEDDWRRAEYMYQAYLAELGQ